MQRLAAIILAVLLGISPAVFAPMQGRADPMPALGPEDRNAWMTVGLVNAAGYRGKASCTGTLIAPDLVLTAAHCASTIAGTGKKRHFVAGWDRGSFVAHRLSSEIHVHPGYISTTGNERFKYDIAVLQLETPIDAAKVPPLPLSDAAPLRLGELAVLGYHRKRPNVINGRFDCVTQPQSSPVIVLLDCEVISGNSGGPVLAQTGDDWTVVAVVAGRTGGNTPQALAVPVGDWVMSHWRDAMNRAEARRSEG
ncbi:trypsin-like peptidase domain-containing protein [uncultured Roseobacter sp.]|uniref:trypsin-like serine peptidase n=1 Tax=uncultured Roseobacter sp. TaxID=114847 RepID=UPI00262969C2|nr:trypsin-like peptidase domain-containing protein [uncultured Roseobacter sp.]